MRTQFKSLYELFEAIPTEEAAVAHFTAIRWAKGEFCPYCGSVERIYHFKDGKNHKCGACRQRFSIKIGTIFEDTKVPMRKWLAAIWLITSHKKGIASTQLARDIAVTQKTAWFMLHRLRYAARTRSFNRPMGGEVEVDETYVGGKAINKHGSRSGLSGTSGKVAVIGAVKRGGQVVAKVVEKSDTKTLDGFVRANVSAKETTLLSTDEHAGYRFLGDAYPHGVVRHNVGEYRSGDHHTNTIEGFWSLLKRQIYGIHHWVSPKHLGRYVDEAAWRYSARSLSDGLRVTMFLGGVDGRLRYVDLIGKA